jgi:hypothetical protein
MEGQKQKQYDFKIGTNLYPKKRVGENFVSEIDLVIFYTFFSSYMHLDG